MKNLPIYLLGMLLTAYLMVMYTAPAFFIVFLGLAAVLVFELLLTLYLRRSISLSVDPPGKLSHCHEMIPVTLHIHNRGLFPVNHLRIRVLYRNRLVETPAKQWLCTYVDGHCHAQVTFHIESDYCGIIRVAADRLWVGSYLRIFGFTKRCDPVMDIPVFPKLFPLNFEISAKIRDFIGESDTYSKEKSGDDPSEVFDIREFRPGDRMQRIHWKLTARLDDFMVKEFSRPVGYPVVVFFNFSRLDGAGSTKTSTQPVPNGRSGRRQKQAGAQKASRPAPASDNREAARGAADHAGLLAAMSGVIEAGLSISAALAREKCWHYIAWCREDMTIERYAIESEEDVYQFTGRLLYAHPHLAIRDTREFYGREWGFDSFCTFLSVNTNMTIEKDGEIYEEKGLDRDTLSGKNFIL